MVCIDSFCYKLFPYFIFSVFVGTHTHIRELVFYLEVVLERNIYHCTVFIFLLRLNVHYQNTILFIKQFLSSFL